MTYLDTHLEQTLGTMGGQSIKQFALILATADSGFPLLGRRLLVAARLAFRAIRTKETPIRAGLAVGCNREALTAYLAIL